MPRYSESEWPPWAQALLAIVILLALVWVFVIQPFLVWVAQNIIPIVLAVAIIATGLGFWRYRKWREDEKSRLETERRKTDFERRQRAKGLIKFIDRFGREYWGRPWQVKKWRRQDQEAKVKESTFYRVAKAIEDFQPSRIYRNEFGYHTELQGWLKSKFPEAKVELKTGASRPDIVIENIAIEVKGPTNNRALDTLTTKCLKYSQYYTHLIAVLFEPQFSETNYREIVGGLEKHFPNVKVIRKD